MPIIDLQRRLREIGRIRIGQQVPIANPKGKAKTRPVKLETFRLTSRDQRVIDAAAVLYGGEPRPWEEQPGQWEVVTQTAELPIMVPPGGLALTQWYEMWSGGGCQRRCDGQNEYVGDQGCLCDPEQRECSIHTRLSVVLSDLQGLGVWRLDTQGWYAATEIGSVVPLLEGAAERGRFLPARLRLEQRQVLRAGKTMKFAVPVIDIDVTVGQMRSLVSGAPPAPVAELANPTTGEITPAEDRPALTPVPVTVEGPTVGDQMKTAEAPASRSRASTPQLPSSGMRPRPRAEAEAAPGDTASLGSRPIVDDDAGRRAQRIAIRLNDLGYDDDARHNLISAVTNGKKASGKLLTGTEENQVLLAAERISRDELELVQGDDGGGWMLAPVGQEPPANEPTPDFDEVGGEDQWKPDEWRAFLASRGVKLTSVIKEAQRLAGELNIDPPGNLDGIIGNASLCSLLRGYVEDIVAARDDG